MRYLDAAAPQYTCWYGLWTLGCTQATRKCKYKGGAWGGHRRVENFTFPTVPSALSSTDNQITSCSSLHHSRNDVSVHGSLRYVTAQANYRSKPASRLPKSEQSQIYRQNIFEQTYKFAAASKIASKEYLYTSTCKSHSSLCATTSCRSVSAVVLSER